MEAVTYFIFLGSKITADSDCNHEIKRHLFLGRRAMTNLDIIFRSRDIADKDSYNQRYGFSSSHVRMCELNQKEGWVTNSWCFEATALEKTHGLPLDNKEIKSVNPQGNQSWIFIGITDAEMKLQYFHHLMQRADTLKQTLMLGKMKAGREEDSRGWDGWMASVTWVWASSRRWWSTGWPGVLQSVGSERVRQDFVTERQQNH